MFRYSAARSTHTTALRESYLWVRRPIGCLKSLPCELHHNYCYNEHNRIRQITTSQMESSLWPIFTYLVRWQSGKSGDIVWKKKKTLFFHQHLWLRQVKSCHTDLLFHNQFWTEPSCAHNGPAPEWGQTRPAPPPCRLQWCLKTAANHNKHLSSLEMILNSHLWRLPERKTFLKVSVQLLVLL